jgi:hypothetical protein
MIVFMDHVYTKKNPLMRIIKYTKKTSSSSKQFFSEESMPAPRLDPQLITPTVTVPAEK